MSAEGFRTGDLPTRVSLQHAGDALMHIRLLRRRGGLLMGQDAVETGVRREVGKRLGFRCSSMLLIKAHAILRLCSMSNGSCRQYGLNAAPLSKCRLVADRESCDVKRSAMTAHAPFE
jgi:hypothetical protein